MKQHVPSYMRIPEATPSSLYRLGIDVGTTSIGWCLISLCPHSDENRLVPCGILDLGTLLFDAAEAPKGGSLAAAHRLIRSARRTLRRKKGRKSTCRALFLTHGLITKKELQSLYPLPKGARDIWDIRVAGLDELLSQGEWVRLLIHLSQRRGFLSNRKSDQKDDEAGKVLSAIHVGRQRIGEYRTVGEMWVKDEMYATHGKRHNGKDEYIFFANRRDVENEIRTLFAAQRNLGSSLASEAFEEAYLDAWGKQLPFASGDMILRLVGECPLKKGHKRIPKVTHTFQYFYVLEELNKLRIGGEVLRQEQRETVLREIFRRTDLTKRKKVPNITYGHLRKWLKLGGDDQFSSLSYGDSAPAEVEKKGFVNLKSYYELRQTVERYASEHHFSFGDADLDAFGYALTVYKTDEDIRSYLQDADNMGKRVYDEALIDELLVHSFSGFGSFSREGIHMLLPLMEEGQNAMSATYALGLDPTGMRGGKKQKLLPKLSKHITNPAVFRSLSKARKLINSIIKQHGSPVSIHIELARDIKKTHVERRKLSDQYTDNRDRNEGVKRILAENGIHNPNGEDIRKYRLWQEQGERCAYSLRHVPPHIFYKGIRSRGVMPMFENDHILPFSRSFWDGYDNKVFVFTEENRKKGDMIPYEYLSRYPGRWEAFVSFVEDNPHFSKRKKDTLLRETYTPREDEELRARHLQDTRYASKFLRAFLEQHLLFAEVPVAMTQRVFTTNGPITAHCRSRWGLEKDRRASHLHHALDAAVIACTDPGMVQQVTRYYQKRERGYAVKEDRFPEPWEGFRDELILRLAQVPNEETSCLLEQGLPLPKYALAVRQPVRKTSGAAHKDTLFQHAGEVLDGRVLAIRRVPLMDIPFDKNGDFSMYRKEEDMATYLAIKERFLKHGRNKQEAFSYPLHKPCKHGVGNVIKRVKLEKGNKAGYRTYMQKVRGGVAENETMLRLDIFLREGVYVAVPVYAADAAAKELPRRIVTGSKGYNQWKELDEACLFQFSLHRHDVLWVRGHGHDRLYYFAGFSISTNQIKLKELNCDHEISLPLAKLKQLTKYQLSLLGDFYQVKRETRQPMRPKQKL